MSSSSSMPKFNSEFEFEFDSKFEFKQLDASPFDRLVASCMSIFPTACYEDLGELMIKFLQDSQVTRDGDMKFSKTYLFDQQSCLWDEINLKDYVMETLKKLDYTLSTSGYNTTNWRKITIRTNVARYCVENYRPPTCKFNPLKLVPINNNQVADLSTGTVRPRTANDMFFFQLPVTYIPSISSTSTSSISNSIGADLFQADVRETDDLTKQRVGNGIVDGYLESMFCHPDGTTDRQLVDYVLYRMNKTLRGSRGMVICEGTGNDYNGKSTFLRIFAKLAGRYGNTTNVLDEYNRFVCLWDHNDTRHNKGKTIDYTIWVDNSLTIPKYEPEVFDRCIVIPFNYKIEPCVPSVLEIMTQQDNLNYLFSLIVDHHTKVLSPVSVQQAKAKWIERQKENIERQANLKN